MKKRFLPGNAGKGAEQPSRREGQVGAAGSGVSPVPAVQAMHGLQREAQQALEAAAARAARVVAQAAESERAKIAGLTNGATAQLTALREEAVRLDRRVGQLERTLDSHGSALTTLSATMSEHAELLGRQAGRDDKQDELLAHTVKTLTRYVEAVDTLRARLVVEDSSFTNTDFLVQYQIGERLRRLFTQRLPDLTSVAVDLKRNATADTDVLMFEAEQVRSMCLALFEGEEPNLAGLAAIASAGGQVTPSGPDGRLLERVQQEAASLRKAIEGTGHSYVFVFDLPAGTVADPSQHDLWTSATAGQPVAFVVTPGYVVSGQRILPPAVITSR